MFVALGRVLFAKVAAIRPAIAGFAAAWRRL
jgi:hypothetical protein